ncbi:hypothetical protein VPH35_100174 [Triticum aestivum]|uniref:Uncharacterized protein n=1 Tax=Aegilops tauschii TaxID=37682 RepID=M8C3B4_AEGTA
MVAANAGGPSRPLPPRTCFGTTQAPLPLKPVLSSGDVQIVLACVDFPPPRRGTCNLDVDVFRFALQRLLCTLLVFILALLVGLLNVWVFSISTRCSRACGINQGA